MSDPRGPNVLVIVCDQLRADHLGFAGNPVVRTPALDALAAGATVFERAYVNNPVCMPNRSTMITGRMPSAHGVVFNDRSLAPSASTFVGSLRDAGWRTALVGKAHLQHGMSREAVVDLGHPPGASSPFPPGWDTVEHQERYEAGEVVAPDDYYGFGHVELAIGHGAWSGGHHYQWARARGVPAERLRCGLDPTADIPGRSPLWWQLYPAPFGEEASSTTFVTERTIDVVERAAADRAPWMVWCSFPDPHHPVAPPRPWFDRHRPDDVPLPPTHDDPGDGWAPHLSLIRSLPADTSGPDRYVLPFGPTADQTRAAIAATYGAVEAIDHGVGRILATVDRLGLADDTVVVFTSDHGDMMGDHGLMLKGLIHYEGCIRVPLVVRVPGGSGARTRSLAASIDLPHTVLDLCDVAEYQGMQGTSLVPVVEDPDRQVRDAILIEDDLPLAAQFGGMPARIRTLVTERHRYTRDSNGWVGLHDLADDPGELHNLAAGATPPAVATDLLATLVDEMTRADDWTRAEPVST